MVRYVLSCKQQATLLTRLYIRGRILDQIAVMVHQIDCLSSRRTVREHRNTRKSAPAYNKREIVC